MTIKMTAPLEVGICVNDMKLMLDFYTRVLGFEYISLAEAAKEKSLKSKFTPSGYEIVRLQTNNGERIKLNRPAEDPAIRVRDKYILERQGSTYLTFLVGDLDELISRLKNANVSVNPEEGKIEVRPGVYLCTALDPEGNWLEFVEYENIDNYRSDLISQTSGRA